MGKHDFLLSRVKAKIFLQLFSGLAVQNLFLSKLSPDHLAAKICFFSKRDLSLFYGMPGVEGDLVHC